ncbi:MAG: hypothetical protein ABII03_04825 [Nanoarchaeota archaeon]
MVSKMRIDAAATLTSAGIEYLKSKVVNLEEIFYYQNKMGKRTDG